MNTYQPMLARTAQKAFNSPDWFFEVKWDGIRGIAYLAEELSLKSRNDKELLQNFPELEELGELTRDVVLDGEIIVMKEGEVDFQLVAQRNQVSKQKDIEYYRSKNPATYIVFDILEREGESLIDQPLTSRRKTLKEVLREGKYVAISAGVEEHGVDYYEAAIEKNLEGIMAKRLDSTYQPGTRSGDWLKIKRVKSCDCVIFGYTPGEGSRSDTFASLLMGLYDDGRPHYVGKVGTGFTDQDLEDTKKKLDEIKVDEKWFNEADIPEGSTWVKPVHVAEIEYQNVTNDLRLRSPSFKGFRKDKPPELCSLIQIKPQRLDEYYRKRDFSNTNEPVGGVAHGQGNSYVTQKHDAKRLHWDFRLERDGVLESWAVPKGPPEEKGEKRLAIKTEDHPLEYKDFEGTIPKGQYGAGEVEIWDKGFYVPVRWEDDKIDVVLAGERLKGRYEIIRYKDNEEDQWLLFKKE